MDFIHDFINTYGATILYTVLTALAGYIGIVVKNIYNKYVNDKTKKDVVQTCVRAVEQIYTDLHGREKLDMCLENASQMLAQKGIEITDIELRMLIEAAVNEFNNGFNAGGEGVGEAGE
ncbi:MAG: phage holin family protein [Clostridia bacterium]|nr:phage holin family protein [Clostridia bacterium]